MFKGTVNLRAEIKGNGLKFEAFEVAIEGPNGDYIVTTVHFTSVATEDDGKELAAKVNGAALDRLTYHHGIAIEDSRIVGQGFSPVNPLVIITARGRRVLP